MGTLEKLKIYLGEDRAKTYSDSYLDLLIEDTTKEAIDYCNTSVVIPDRIIIQMVIIKLNKYNAEGITSQSLGGNSESFIEFYPLEVLSALNKYRKVKFL